MAAAAKGMSFSSKCRDRISLAHRVPPMQQHMWAYTKTGCGGEAYARCGSICGARNVFERMKERDVITWNVMIGELAHGFAGEAYKLFLQMQRDGMRLRVQLFWSGWRTFIGVSWNHQNSSRMCVSAMRLFTHIQSVVAWTMPDKFLTE